MKDDLGPSSLISKDLQPGSDDTAAALAEKLGAGKYKKYVRFFVAALSSIPWIGGVIGAAASLTTMNFCAGFKGTCHRIRFDRFPILAHSAKTTFCCAWLLAKRET